MALAKLLKASLELVICLSDPYKDLILTPLGVELVSVKRWRRGESKFSQS